MENNFKIVRTKQNDRDGTCSICSEQGPVQGSDEDNNKPSGSITGKSRLEQTNIY
jgi:hypothetical protein